MNLAKGTTTKMDATFNKEFAEIAGPQCKTISLTSFLQNVGVIHFLLLEQEERELAAKGKK